MSSDTKAQNPLIVTTPTDTSIRMERIFDAPIELVWECYTDPEAMAEWLGPHRLNVVKMEADVRVGGSYSFSHEDPENGEVYSFEGEYLEVEAPRLLVQTFRFLGWEGAEQTDRVEFFDMGDGRTQLIAFSECDTKATRDEMLKSGMEKGVVEGYEKLDDILTRRSGK